MILLRFSRLARLNLSPSYKSYENHGSDIYGYLKKKNHELRTKSYALSTTWLKKQLYALLKTPN